MSWLWAATWRHEIWRACDRSERLCLSASVPASFPLLPDSHRSKEKIHGTLLVTTRHISHHAPSANILALRDSARTYAHGGRNQRRRHHRRHLGDVVGTASRLPASRGGHDTGLRSHRDRRHGEPRL